MGCDIHMSAEVRRLTGYAHPDRAVQALKRQASAGCEESRLRLQALEVREGPFEVVAIETSAYHPDFEGPALPKEPGWRAQMFPWSWSDEDNPCGGWVATRLEEVPAWWNGRDYECFARLAGVRNKAEGFGGLYVGASVVPISAPRGLPADFNPPSLRVVESGYTYEQFELGDHSHTWLLASEILAYGGWGDVSRGGLVDLASYRAWKAGDDANPAGWNAGAGGTHISEEEAPTYEPGPGERIVFVRARWTSPRDWPPLEMAKAWAERFGAESVRFTFGFDS